MIKSKTVLVLGAGASVPYSFPTGAELVRKIREHAEAPSPICFQSLTRNEQVRTIETKLETLANELRLAQPDSIDEFLERRPELAETGKVILAIILLNAERVSEKHMWDDKTSGHWYKLLKARLVGPIDSLIKHKLKIISFNYDRSLEYYLYKTLQPYYANEPSEVFVDKIKQIPFLHIYGSLGPLQWQSTKKAIPYGPNKPGSSQIISASENVNIMHEGSNDKVQQNFKKAQEWLKWSHNIFFLGFGFHQDNVRRLGLVDSISFQKTAKATCLGLPLTNKNSVSWSWTEQTEEGAKVIKRAVEFPDPEADCYTFLHDYVILQ